MQANGGQLNSRRGEAARKPDAFWHRLQAVDFFGIFGTMLAGGDH